MWIKCENGLPYVHHILSYTVVKLSATVWNTARNGCLRSTTTTTTINTVIYGYAMLFALCKQKCFKLTSVFRVVWSTKIFRIMLEVDM